MMKAQDLKNSILQMALEGKLVPQDPNDEPASVLLERIREEKERLIKEKKIKRNNKESFIFRKDNHFYEKIGKKGEAVCIDDEIPFDIPDNWELCRLNVVNNIFTGNSINKSEKEKKFTGLTEGYNYIATKDVDFDNSINYDNGVKIPKELERFRVAKSGSVLLCIEGGSAGRKIALTNQDVCFGNKLCCFTSYGINNKFLYYYLQSPIFKEVFKSETSGIIGGVGVGKIRNFFVPIPSLEEQLKIVKKLEILIPYVKTYGTFEEELQKLNEEFPKKIKESILQDAIQGKLVPQDPNDEPASVLLERIREEKEQLIKEKKIKRNKNESFIFKENNHFYEKIGKNEPVCIDDEIPFKIPSSWRWCRLENIAFITKLAGFEYTKYVSPNISTKGIPLLKAKYIKGDKLLNEFEDYIPKELSDNLIRSKVNKKCILTPYIGASIGNVVYFEGFFEAHLAPNLAKIEMYGNINEKYIVNYIKSPLGYYELTKYLKSTAQPSISMAALRDMLIPLPPLNEQMKIVRKIEELCILFN